MIDDKQDKIIKKLFEISLESIEILRELQATKNKCEKREEKLKEQQEKIDEDYETACEDMDVIIPQFKNKIKKLKKEWDSLE